MLHRDEDLIRLSAVWKPLWLCSSSSFYPFNYRPQTKLREGNVFTPVRDIVMGGLCWGGVSVQGVVCPGGSPSRGSLPKGLCSGESLSMGISLQGGLCPGGVSVMETPRTVEEQAVHSLLECILVFHCNKILQQWLDTTFSVIPTLPLASLADLIFRNCIM